MAIFDLHNDFLMKHQIRLESESNQSQIFFWMFGKKKEWKYKKSVWYRKFWSIERMKTPNQLILAHENKWRFFEEILINWNSFQIKLRWYGNLENKVRKHLDDINFILNSRKAAKWNMYIPSFTTNEIINARIY
jgi:hypothetical protein